MDILTIGEVLIDLTQTGKDEKGIPQFAANCGMPRSSLPVWVRSIKTSPIVTISMCISPC